MRTQAEFWAAVDQSAGPKACWPWTWATKPSGYGAVYWARRMQIAHRVALLLTVGEPPLGKPYAMHLCDNPPCCNPAHLEWGSAQENSNQMVQRGRHRDISLPGELNPRVKLTEAQVLEIRASYPGVRQVDLAAKYGVKQVAISRIVRRVSWKHL